VRAAYRISSSGATAVLRSEGSEGRARLPPLLVNPADDVSLSRVINVPARGIGGVTLASLADAARRRGSSMAAVLEVLGTHTPIRSPFRLRAAGAWVDVLVAPGSAPRPRGGARLGGSSRWTRRNGLSARLRAEANRSGRSPRRQPGRSSPAPRTSSDAAVPSSTDRPADRGVPGASGARDRSGRDRSPQGSVT
jgi:hypothetical protein